MVHLHDGILHSRKKEGTPILHNRMDTTRKYYIKWNKLGSERQIPYDLIYKWNLINKTNQQNRTRVLEIKNKLTVTTEGGSGNNWGKIRKGQAKKKKRGLMDVDNGGGLTVGVRETVGWAIGKEAGHLLLSNNKFKKIILLSHETGILPFVTTWMDIMLSKRSQTEKDNYHMIALICEI